MLPKLPPIEPAVKAPTVTISDEPSDKENLLSASVLVYLASNWVWIFPLIPSNVLIASLSITAFTPDNLLISVPVAVISVEPSLRLAVCNSPLTVAFPADNSSKSVSELTPILLLAILILPASRVPALTLPVVEIVLSVEIVPKVLVIEPAANGPTVVIVDAPVLPTKLSFM